MFHIGQKVVCVNADKIIPNLSLATLAKGQQYTIRWIGIFQHALDAEPSLHVRLEEILRPCGNDIGTQDMPYRAQRFRPIVEKKTDISTLTALLNPINHKHLEGV